MNQDERRQRKREYDRKRYLRPEVRAKQQEYVRAYRLRPEVRARDFALRYGVDEAEALQWTVDWDRDHVCWLCGEGGAAHLDHNHDTKTIRGWTHSACNSAEGLIKISPNPKALVDALSRLHGPIRGNQSEGE